MEPDFSWDDYVIIDTETTGLDETRHHLLELSYAVGRGEPKTLYPWWYPNIFETAEPMALQVNQMFRRFDERSRETVQYFGLPSTFINFEHGNVHTDEYIPTSGIWLAPPEPSLANEWVEFLDAIEGKILVGANVEFDVKFTQKIVRRMRPGRHTKMNHHHRLFQIGSYAAGKFGKPYPMSFGEIRERALGDNFPVHEIDHTAAGDVRATRDVFAYLMDGQYSDE